MFNKGGPEMRVLKTATMLLAAPLFLTACNKAETPAAEATDNAATAATDNAMDAATPADVNNSGVAEMSSSGPGIIPSKSSAEGGDPAATQTTNTTTAN
ncbi:MAG TPA: hypothetical protein PKI78_06890 [Anaerolineales bacterium]|nr:hypothetical protein [Anaerolineales bacterium]